MRTRTKLTMRRARSIFLAAFLTCFAHVSAQTVSITPNTGNIIAAESYDGEQHLEGYGGCWIHHQLPLTLISSDHDYLTANGLMQEHANNISYSGSQLVIVAGDPQDISNHMSLSLPKGYRFTGYKMTLAYKEGDASVLSETDATFSTTNASASVTKSTTNVSLARTSMSQDDMGNVLYFRQTHSGNNGGYVTITSFEVTYECSEPFIEALAPTMSGESVDCMLIPFETERVDLGAISKKTVNKNTSFKYNYNNVTDLAAAFSLYDVDGIKDGEADPTAMQGKHISTVLVGQKPGFGLQNDTYYIETPTEALAQGDVEIALGYRITGAKLYYSNTSQSAAALGSDLYIMDDQGLYMNASLTFTSTPVTWQSTSDGKIYTGSTYLVTSSSGRGSSNKTLSTTTRSNQATSYTISGTKLYSGNYVVSFTSDNKGSYSGTQAIVTGTSASESRYTLALYDKAGEAIAQEVTVDGSNPSGYIEVDGMNNDAVKFVVSNLTGEAAFVGVDLTLEALNPYIQKVDIVGTQIDGSKQLSQQFTTKDFALGTDGEVAFKVPINFAPEGKKVKFSFDHLTNKNADDTYGPLSSVGNSRYHFVKSAYYDLINENLQAHRTEAANYDYSVKVLTEHVGNQQFKVNNTDEFNIGSDTNDKTFYVTDTRFSYSKFAEQGGSFQEVELTKDGEQDCYVMVCDETRYNIAPTTVPRHSYYTFYKTHIKLETENYQPVLTYHPIYDHAMLASGYDDNSYVGVTISLKDADGTLLADQSQGYVLTKQVTEQLSDDISNKVSGAPVDGKHVLYVDASNLNAMLYGEESEWGKMESLQEMIGYNALILLPEGTTYSAHNIASKTVFGDFKAENNIILSDQQPFYTPYDIRIDAANEVIYDRLLTKDNGAVKWFTTMLPFTVAVDENGVYHLGGKGGTLTFYQMNANNALDNIQMVDNYNYMADGHFSPITGQTATNANTPYLVSLENMVLEDESSPVMFSLRQRGSTINKTPTSESIEGETAQASATRSSATLTQYGTYCGEKISKDQDVFYFAKDRFVSSANLLSGLDYVYVMPFRTWYASNGVSEIANIAYINISTLPGETTGLDAIATDQSARGFAVSTDKGQLTLHATQALQARICNINGQNVSTIHLKAGETRTLPVASGIYLINGTKVMVR